MLAKDYSLMESINLKSPTQWPFTCSKLTIEITYFTLEQGVKYV